MNDTYTTPTPAAGGADVAAIDPITVRCIDGHRQIGSGVPQ